MILLNKTALFNLLFGKLEFISEQISSDFLTNFTEMQLRVDSNMHFRGTVKFLWD